MSVKVLQASANSPFLVPWSGAIVPVLAWSENHQVTCCLCISPAGVKFGCKQGEAVNRSQIMVLPKLYSGIMPDSFEGLNMITLLPIRCPDSWPHWKLYLLLSPTRDPMSIQLNTFTSSFANLGIKHKGLIGTELAERQGYYTNMCTLHLALHRFKHNAWIGLYSRHYGTDYVSSEIQYVQLNSVGLLL